MIGLRDAFRLFGVTVVCACAVFVSTFCLNYYLDALSIGETVAAENRALYDAQVLSSKLTSAVSGACLLLIAVVLVVFYTRLFIDDKAKTIGSFKAMGYSEGRLALSFWVFGLSAFLGTAIGQGAGYAFCPYVYKMMSEGFYEVVPLHYHFSLTAALVIAPTCFFSALSILCAYLKLRLPVMSLLRGKTEKAKKHKNSSKERSFLTDVFLSTPAAHKSLAFFVAFAGFCFSAMLQMGWSMRSLSSETMGIVMLVIGIVLAVCVFSLAMTSLVRANAKTVSLMKAYGYRFLQYGNAVFGGFRPFAYLGFGIGTLYQWGLLKIIMELVFQDVGANQGYSFEVDVFFVVLALFIVVYEAATLYFTYRIGKENIRKFVTE